MKKFLDFIKENQNKEKFLQDLLSGNTWIQKHTNDYKVDTKLVAELIDKIILTDEFKKLLIVRNLDIPVISKLKYKLERNKYHKISTYTLTDTDENFLIEVGIEIPIDDDFEVNESIISCTIYIKKYKKNKEIFTYLNKKIFKDKEFIYYSIGELLNKVYKNIFSNIS